MKPFFTFLAIESELYIALLRNGQVLGFRKMKYFTFSKGNSEVSIILVGKYIRHMDKALLLFISSHLL